MSIKPIQPHEISHSIPGFVIEIFNDILKEKYFGSKITIKQDLVMDKIMAMSANNFTRQDVYNQHWLDVEDVFREAGWVVTFDKPAYCETHDAHWTFKAK